MHIQVNRTRAIAAVGAIAALTAALVGCSSSSTSPSATSTTDTAALGTPDKATGQPVTIGFIGEGKAAVLDQTDEYRGAQAAAAYANDYLGGINGHPIQVKVCQTLDNPAAATDCANQMVHANASAVVEGVLGEVDQTIAVLSQAKIPLFVGGGATQAALATPGVFEMSNTLAYFAAAAQNAKSQGVSKVALAVIGVPAAAGPAQQIGGMVFANAGINLNVVPIPPGVADATPQITAADAAHPGLYYVFGQDTFCTSVLKAINTVDPSAKITIIDHCISPGSGKSIPGGYQGDTVMTATNLSPDSADGKLFAAILDKYGDGAASGSTAATGYAPMLGLVAALNAAKVSDLTPAGVLAAVTSAPPVTYPLSGGMQVQCNGKQVALSPNICSTDFIVATADKDGTLSNYQRVPVSSALYAPPQH